MGRPCESASGGRGLLHLVPLREAGVRSNLPMLTAGFGLHAITSTKRLWGTRHFHTSNFDKNAATTACQLPGFGNFKLKLTSREDKDALIGTVARRRRARNRSADFEKPGKTAPLER